MHTTNLNKWQLEHYFHEGIEHGARNTRRVMMLTASMIVVEIVAGVLGGSMALLPDGWHCEVPQALARFPTLHRMRI